MPSSRLAVCCLLLAACAPAAHELGQGPAGRDGALSLVEALADRFGPVEREPAFDALRPKLAQASLIPSRVFDDPSAWPRRGDDWRAVEFTGYGAGGSYRIGVRAEAAEPVEVSQYRSRLRLRRTGGGRYEWTTQEELAIGALRPQDLARALDALLLAAERTSAGTAREAVARSLPRASGAFGRLLHIEALELVRDPHGATAVRLAVRLVPEGISASAPRYAAFLRKYATPVRGKLVVADATGAAWWTLEAAANLWTLRLRVRDGSLVPLEGAAERRLPAALRATTDYATRMGRFSVAVRGLVANVTLQRWPEEKGLTARFVQQPDWDLPFLVEPLLGGPLHYPFEGEGSELSWGARQTPSGGTSLFGYYRARVRETWILRWLGGMTSRAISEFRRGAEREADSFNRECLLALRDDLAALVAVDHVADADRVEH